MKSKYKESLDTIISYIPEEYRDVVANECNTLRGLIRKETPIKLRTEHFPQTQDSPEEWVCECRSCGMELYNAINDVEELEYCPYCGQHLNLGGDE